MLNVLKARWQQKFRTVGFPDKAPELPDRFRGLPVVDTSRCDPDCRLCAQACPAGAIRIGKDRRAEIDMGLCLFCPECEALCPHQALRFTRDHSLAARGKNDLVLRPGEDFKRAEALGEEMRKIFGRSFKLRQVSAGGCNACEADINVLTTVVFDLSRFGIEIVASPRHADGLLVTGPVTQNMKLALEKTYRAVPDPKIVIAVGACAISGGPYAGHSETCSGVDPVIPVDLYIPGCPPHPITILDGLLRLLGRVSRD